MKKTAPNSITMGKDQMVMSRVSAESERIRMALTTAESRTFQQRALEGHLNDLPAEQSSVVKVFFSSTFTDMTTERNLLMKEAVPHLRDYCKDRGLDYQVVDMRWGVREDASVEHTTTDLCLQEIVHCQQDSAAAYFVAFLGDRYGSRLLPTTIPVTEYRSLRRLASWMDVSEFASVDKWYIVDTNAVPAVYQIQPITALCPHYNDTEPKNRIIKQQHQQTWERDKTKMMHAFRVVSAEAHSRGMISSKEYEKYYISVTHREVNLGIVNSPDVSRKNAEKVLCFHRTLKNIAVTDVLAKRFIDLTEEGELDHEAADLRGQLLDVVTQHLHKSGMSQHTISWTDCGVTRKEPFHAAYLRTLCDTFTGKMIHIIDKCLKERESATVFGQELYQEILTHLRFCNEKCQVFCGREKELHKIQTLMDKARGVEENSNMKDEASDKMDKKSQEESPQNNDMQALLDMCEITGATFAYGDTFDDLDSDPSRDLQEEHVTLPRMDQYKRPIIIHGMSGSGKTALMAKIAQLSKKWIPHSACVVRFMGTTSASSSIRDTLISIILHVLKLYEMQPPPGLNLNIDYHYLILYFRALLWRIDSQSTPLFLLMDSVDQLHPMDYAHMLTWLPKKVPCNVYLFVSMASDHPSCLPNAREHLPHDDQFVKVGRMDRGSGDKMVRAVCHQACRTLTASQRNLLLDTFIQSGKALHLKLITDQALSWRSHYKTEQLKVAKSVEGAIEHLFDDLERNHGEVLVAKALGYLTLSKLGVGDGEMEDLLSLDDEVLQDTYLRHLPPDPTVIRLAPSLWIRLKGDINAYLAKQRAGERHVNTWYHRQFQEAAMKRYAHPAVVLEFHQAMADYFMGVWSAQPKPLELFKGKSATYEDCQRGVPAQPLVFHTSKGNKKVYNIRKLQELPHHLSRSSQWDTFHAIVACNAEWLVATSQSLGVMVLLHQFKDMLACSLDDASDDTKQKAKDIAVVQSIINMGVDDIRRDPSTILMQILGQLGPQYKGTAGMEDLIRQCKDHLNSSEQGLFVPLNAFMPAPGGLLLSSINTRLYCLGSERVSSPNISLDEEKRCLHVLEQSSSTKPDNMLIMDYENAGIVISRDKLPFYVHTYTLVAKRRFHLFKIYTVLSKYEPQLEYMLFEGSLAVPYIFDKTVVAMSVASHGQLIAYAFKDDQTVSIGTPDSKARKVLVKQHMFMEYAIHTLLFSPDASQLVAIDNVGNISVYSVTHRQATSLHTSTERTFFHRLKETYHITRSNLLLRTVYTGQHEHALSIMDLVTRQEKHRLTSEKLKYKYNMIELDELEEFVVVCNTESMIVNGNTQRPALIWRMNSGELVTVIDSRHHWTAVKLIGKDTLICLASHSDTGVIRVLNCGLRESPDFEPSLLCELKDHSKSVTTLLPISNNTMLVSGSEDNTIKFWALGLILQEQSQEEENRTLPRRKNKKKKKKMAEKLTEVELLGKTTALAVTGMADEMAYFGTDNGVVGYTKLKDCEEKGVRLITVTSDLPPVHLLLLSRKGDYLMAAAKNTVAVMDAREGKLLYKVPGLTGQRKISCIAEGGNTAALGHGGMEGKVKLWELKSGEFIRELSFLYSFELTAINRSGTQVVASMFEYPIVINIYGLEKEEIAGGGNLSMDKLDTLMTGLTFICISPDDSLVAACASNGSTRIVSTDNRYLHRLQQRSTPTCALFTADSQQLLTSGYRSIYVWRMGEGKLDFKLTRHQDFVTCLKFAWDDRFLISSSLDRTVAIWDFMSRATVCTIQTQCQLQSVHLLPDLSKLVYIPDRVANMAVIEPNPAMQKVLEKGRRMIDIAEPETLENASAFAASFNTQKDTSKNTSSACVIL